MGDIISSESSLFWRLNIPPTRFDGFFCESVTRQFESDPEPCSQQDHIWKCVFTENMINGVATIDIVIQRVEVKKKNGSSSPFEGRQQGQQEHSSSSHSQMQTLMQDQQEHDQLQRQQGQERQQLSPTKDNRPAQIHYKTIALHTPKTLAPLMSIFLDGSTAGNTPIRGKSSSHTLSHDHLINTITPLCHQLELEANAIWHRGNYVFEIVLSEDILPYMNPSPSSCHRVFDSLYHGIVVTSHPDISTADIWFEFHPHSATASEAATANASTQDRRTLPSTFLPVDQRHLHHKQEHPDGSAAVVVVGAHFKKLVRYPYFADWIEREKRAQEDQRRRQLEDEWRIHQEHHEHFPQQHPQYQPHQRAEYQPRDIPTYFQSLQGSSSSSLSSLSALTSLPLHQQQHSHHVPPQHQHQQQHHSRSELSRPQHINQLVPLSPTLRIPVKGVSLGTFKVILQYIYTGSIGLSDGQIKDIDKYWNDNPEDHLAPHQNRSPLDDEDTPLLSSLLAYSHPRDRPKDSDSGGVDGSRIAPRPPIVLPVPGPLREVLGDQQQARQGGEEGRGRGPVVASDRPHTGIKDIIRSDDIFTFTTASAQTAWTTCLPRNRRKEFRDPQSLPSAHVRQQQPMSNHDEQSVVGSSRRQSQRGSEGEQASSSTSELHSAGGPSASSSSFSFTTSSTHPPTHQTHVHKTSPTCSWESLLLAANLFQLQDLETTALKAIKYHCQMLASRALISNNVMAEVAHDGFYRSNLDLQLALGERILLSLLKLYRSPLLTVHPKGVWVLRGGQGGAGGGGSRSECRKKGTGGGEGGEGSEPKIQEHAREGHVGLQTQLEELFRHQAEDQQGSGGGGGHGGGGGGEEEQEKGKESGNKDDDRKQQDEGHLGTALTSLSSSSSSPSARTRGGSGGGAASSRTRGSRRPFGQGRNIGTAAQQQQRTAQEHEPELSSSTRTRNGTTSGNSSRSARAASYCQRQPDREEEENDGGDEGEEGKEVGGSGSERVTTPLSLLDHPECQDALQGLCEELRERFLSLREVIESPHRDPRNGHST
ncbi:hypothetical protein EC957_003479 [Mortierella hygrophila]|uniref:BTB domain-containing protein n=1 Tax=Mortierella hygrophila TaxID=979708 RepID=A0A9P6K775_9FUNG|nr:hypothetical protein EC957_003479 [Mortierella hygrophila]